MTTFSSSRFYVPSKLTKGNTLWLRLLTTLLIGIAPSWLWASQLLFEVHGKKTSKKDLEQTQPDLFYEAELEKYNRVSRQAEQAYLKSYWELEGKKANKSADKAMMERFESVGKVEESEIKAAMTSVENDPRFKKLSPEERRMQITRIISSNKVRGFQQNLIEKAKKSGDLKVHYPRPKEPIFNVAVENDDYVRFGPKTSDTSKSLCKDSCPVTVVEYSEYQCPYCARVIPDARRLLTDYKGKVQWIVRDFPLDFHDRAKPAAIAAKCAGFQGQDKFWAMYEKLFENQTSLKDADFVKYAGEINLDAAKFKACVANPDKALAIINKKMNGGRRLGVTGTPAFFINGRRLSGAQPYSEFKRIFDEEIAKKTKPGVKRG